MQFGIEPVNVMKNYLVFISFSSKDKRLAEKIYDKLEQDGVACWMSSRDIPPGGDYQACIVEAIDQARLVVLVFSSQANESQEVAKELALASTKTVIPARIEDVLPKGAFQYQLSNRQFIDLFDKFETKLSELSARVKQAVGESSQNSKPMPKTRLRSGARGRGRWMALSGVLTVLIVMGSYWWWGLRVGGEISVISEVPSRIPAEQRSVNPAAVAASTKNDDKANLENHTSKRADTRAAELSGGEALREGGGQQLQAFLAKAKANVSQDLSPEETMLTAVRALPENLSAQDGMVVLGACGRELMVKCLDAILVKLSPLLGADALSLIRLFEKHEQYQVMQKLARGLRIKSGISAVDFVSLVTMFDANERSNIVELLLPLLGEPLEPKVVVSLYVGLHGQQWQLLSAVLKQRKLPSDIGVEDVIALVSPLEGMQRQQGLGLVLPLMNGVFSTHAIQSLLTGVNEDIQKASMEALVSHRKMPASLSAQDFILLLMKFNHGYRLQMFNMLHPMLSENLAVDAVVDLMRGMNSDTTQQQLLSAVMRSRRMGTELDVNDVATLAMPFSGTTRTQVIAMALPYVKGNMPITMLIDLGRDLEPRDRQQLILELIKARRLARGISRLEIDDLTSGMDDSTKSSLLLKLKPLI